MPKALDFTGKTALIMGASKGIGLATAETLASLGATVILAARSAESLASATKKIRNSGGVAKAQVCDVSSYASVESAVEYTLSQTGQIDFLINNAGVIEPLSHFIDSDPNEWALAADINYKGVYYLSLIHI